ncbi:endogenous retroviral envelope protein HEMO [Aquila chrysaetos chrysaetos]|uniref:endogenous retroviral envelope protein HEMO n=1 Tax=Aquila chrysaetos chrysaetos TaxID=223781 RepID=UPI001B7D4469|nr:endogenous retroviral envelope protein HEMO [Aquila chrysaetos chrysaetos]
MTSITSGLHLSWRAPEDLAIFWLCGNKAYKALPPIWGGICTLGVMSTDLEIHPKTVSSATWHRTFLTRIRRTLNPLIERSTGFNSFVRWLIPALGVSELEKAVLNVSGETEKLANSTAHGLSTLQKEVTELSKMTIQNRMALNMILASQGGVCTVLNTSCCMYTDRSGELMTDVQKIWEVSAMMQQIQRDDTSWGFSDTFSWLTSWFPNLATWVKKLIVIVLVVIIIVVCVIVLFQCCISCSSKIIQKIEKKMWSYQQDRRSAMKNKRREL